MGRVTGIISVIWVVWVSMAAAQQPDSVYIRVQQQLEEALEEFDTADPDRQTEQLTQQLLDLARHPVNINTASAGDLLAIPGVSLKTAQAVVAYRSQEKPFGDIAELRRVRGIGTVRYRRMAPYVTVGSGLARGRRLYGDHRFWTHKGQAEIFARWQQTLQRREGFRRTAEEGGYVGSPVGYYQRIRYRSSHLSVNMTQQKDAGERRTGTLGFDYSSAHVALKDAGKLRSLVFGDYGLYFGQGLVLWNGRSFGKGRSVISAPSRNGRGVRPYASSQESDFFRGVAATYGRTLQASAFYSARNHTAGLLEGDTLRMPRSDGYHRTHKERQDRGRLGQALYGGRLQFRRGGGTAGLTYYRTIYGQPVSGGDRLYDRYEFRGRKNAVAGLDMTLTAGPFVLFGEGARSRNGGWGMIAGVRAELGPATEGTLIYRQYGTNFQSLMGNGFGEYGGPPANEEGWYVGIRHQVNAWLTLRGYFDQFQAPAPRFGIAQAAGGYDWLVLAEVTLGNEAEMYLQVRSESEDREYTLTDERGRETIQVGRGERSTGRLQLSYQINPNIRWRSRLEGVRSRGPGSGAGAQYGYLLYQDLRYRPSDRFSVQARATLFDTDSYQTRLYQFENDMLYVLSSTMLYEQGQRLYVLVHAEPLPYLELWAKFGITVFENRADIGSGLSRIQGNRRSEAGLQIRLKF